jgi:hypothetical protein
LCGGLHIGRDAVLKSDTMKTRRSVVSRKARIALPLIFFGLVMAVSASTAAAAVPYQWLAKQYTEGLGRGPDPGGWNGYVDWFQANVCNQSNLKTKGREILTSSEFETRGYNNAQRLFILQGHT